MQLIVIVILGALLGFMYGTYSDGFYFSSLLCLFAGLTLIMPSLFKFELSHVRLVWEHKQVMLKSLLVNYLLLPMSAIGIGVATDDFGLTAGLFLVAVLSGGGMVMHWIKKSNANSSFGFLLLFVNLLLIPISLMMLHLFATYASVYFDASYSNEVSVAKFAFPVIVLLIVLPFIVSRVVRLIKPLVNTIQTYQKYISHLSIFMILFYLFGLQSSQLLVEIYDFEPELFYVAFGAVVVFYAVIFGFSKFIYNLENPQERAVFWHTITRYLTLALVIATFSVNTFGVSMLLPIMFAYLIQIPLSVYVAKQHMPTL